MKTKIIFDYQLNGHNIEYLHHLYEGASRDAQTKYIFSLPEEFDEVKHFMEWPAANNIEFDLYRLSVVKSSRPIITALKSSLYLRKLAKKTGAEEIILVWMMAVLPFIGFLMPKGVKISGIVDLDDDSFEYWSFDTWLPSYAVQDNTVLDYLLEELTLDVDVLDPENVDLVVLLNGTMSFHRSRRIENNNDQPLIEFV